MSMTSQEPALDATRDRILGRTVVEWAMPEGPNIIDRTHDFHDYCNLRRRTGYVPVCRSVEGRPETHIRSRLETGVPVEGMNFGSQDYLGLSTDPRVQEAAIRAIHDFGVHSASSGALQGSSPASLALEAEVGDLLEAPHVTLFPTGWSAGFGVITGLVRQTDHIVMDRLAHACLQQGAHAATANIRRHGHLDVERATEKIRDIRASDARGGILVVTEGTFSMDADSPRLEVLVEACRTYDATLLVDVAHDLGELGPGGTGQIGLQGMLGQVDLVMGVFSKTFGSCGGFVASASPALKDYLRVFAGTFMFSNALSPVQTAVAREAMMIARSEEGDRLRAELQRAALSLRGALADRGLDCYGDPCAIVAVKIGDETVASIAHKLVMERGVLTNIVEFPAVGIGEARFRMQLMPGHTDEMVRSAATIVADAVDEAREIVARDMEVSA